MDLAELGIRIDSASAVSGVSNLDRLTDAASRAEVATEKLATTSTGAARGFSLAGNNGRMLAMQLSQVGQQGAATGNFLQALSIQAADIGMMFGAFGAIAGTVAGVALPMLMQAFGGTTDKAAEVKEQIDGLHDAVSAYRDAIEAANAPNETLIAQYGRMAEVARAALDAQRQIAMVEAINQTNLAISAVLSNLTEFRDYATGNFLEVADSVRVLKDTFDMTSDEIGRVQEGFRALAAARTLEQQAMAARQVQEALMAAYGSISDMPAPLRDAYGQMSQIVIATGETQTLTDGTGLSAERLAQRMADAYGMYAATRNIAAELADQTERAASAAASLAYGKIANSGGMDSVARATMAKYTPNPFGKLASGAGGAFKPDRSSKGGGGSNEYENDLESLIKDLSTKTEVTQAWYEESRAMLADHRAQEILGTQQHQEAMIALEAEYQSRMSEIQGQAQQQRMSEMSGFFGALAGIASAGGERMVKTVAAFEAVQGTINAYGAAVKALNTPGLTIWGRMAAYGSVLAAGLKGVAAIRSAGGIGGGSSAGGTVAAQGATTQAPQGAMLTVAGINRTDLLTGEMLEGILDGIAKIGPIRGIKLIGAA